VGRAILRSTAKPGDAIFVTGRLGEAESGLRLLKKGASVKSDNDALRKHLYPEPRLAVGAWLARERLATAMMDLSDGLSSDLARLCDSSRVGARIYQTEIPCAKPTAPSPKTDALALALHGGDDYELLFTVSQRKAGRVPDRIGLVPVARIGEVTKNRVIQLVRRDGTTGLFIAGGWDPFRT